MSWRMFRLLLGVLEGVALQGGLDLFLAIELDGASIPSRSHKCEASDMTISILDC